MPRVAVNFADGLGIFDDFSTPCTVGVKDLVYSRYGVRGKNFN